MGRLDDGDLDLWLANRTGPQLRLMRNNGSGEHPSLSLKLVGSTVNRDAIGARVELHPVGDGPVRVRQLAAGNGFLSQGSKWMHFGLGKATEIERVVVHWPGGNPEVFVGLRAGGRYRLVQQSGDARSVAPRKTPVRLTASLRSAPEATRQAGVHLASRPPAPALRYRDWNDRSRSLDMATGRPQLLNLWASWCAPCAAELADLARSRKGLKKIGVKVTALSVDGLGDERATDVEALRDYLRRLDFPYASGQATAELVDKLELLFARTFGRHVALPVPTSFLFDADGRLAVVYFGQVEVETLLADVEHLDLDDEELRARATPFSGRWLSPPRAADLGLLAREYLRAGYPEDAEPLLRTELKSGKAEPRQLLATALSLLDRNDEAERFYREAIALDPTAVRARYNYARLLAGDARHREAAEQLAQVLLFEPANANARLAMAEALLRTGRSVDALKHYRLRAGYSLACRSAGG